MFHGRRERRRRDSLPSAPWLWSFTPFRPCKPSSPDPPPIVPPLPTGQSLLSDVTSLPPSSFFHSLFVEPRNAPLTTLSWIDRARWLPNVPAFLPPRIVVSPCPKKRNLLPFVNIVALRQQPQLAALVIGRGNTAGSLSLSASAKSGLGSTIY